MKYSENKSMKDVISQALKQAAIESGIDIDVFAGQIANPNGGQIQLDYPENPEHGDFSSNIAMANAKKLGVSPKVLAEKIVKALLASKTTQPDIIDSITVAGPGFINFKIKDQVFIETVAKTMVTKSIVPEKPSKKKVMVEYTDPNPFKIFHIGHLMSNAIGESISRLIQTSGVEVVRACYGGDVGLHVAKTIWAIQKDGGFEKKAKISSVTEKVKWLGDMYVQGSKFDDDASIQKEIAITNKKIFEKSDAAINKIYEEGRKWSLEYFDLIYSRLGTKFDRLFFESEVADLGMKIVKEFSGISEPVFKVSEGAVVFPGEEYGLHTRVFVTSNGLPTYETKELGLNTRKFELYPDLGQSVIITASEQNDYFKVLLKAFSLIDPKIAQKTKHINHGIMRFASGKMSSRKGNIVSAESLISDVRELVQAKISERKFSKDEADKVSDLIAIGAIKYTILRQSIGGDVIFDSSASVSFEGDSGPYLQYAAVRAGAMLDKAKQEGINTLDLGTNPALPTSVSLVEKLLTRFPDTVERARLEYSPQHIAGYLINLAGAFNSFYATQQVVDVKNPLSPYYVALTQVFRQTMINGLWLLGIKVPERM